MCDELKFCTELVAEDPIASLRAAIKENPDNIAHGNVSTIASADDQLALSSQMMRDIENAQPAPFIAFLRTRLWWAGRVLKISFIGNVNATVKQKIIEKAMLWQPHISVKLNFISKGAGDIRITTHAGGSWSYVGTDALLIPKDKPTMNYGWLLPETSDREYERVVVHEFGHALGAIHEHQHYGANIPWDKPKVYAYYARMGWSKDQVDTNIFARYSMSQLNASQYDQSSIMHYAVPNELTIGDWAIPWNTTLSIADKAFAARVYP